MANKTLFELATDLRNAERLVDVYKKESMKTEKEISDLEQSIKDEQQTIDDLTKDEKSASMSLDKEESRLKLEKAALDAAVRSDFETDEEFDNFKAKQATLITKINQMIDQITDGLSSTRAEIKSRTQEVSAKKARLDALKASDIVKKIGKAKDALTAAQEVYDAAVKAEEDAIKLDDSTLIFDQKPSDRFDSVERFTTAAGLSIINRALIETVEDWTSKYAGVGPNVLEIHSNHPNLFVRGYSDGIKWDGTNKEAIETFTSEFVDKSKDAYAEAEEKQVEARNADRSIIFLQHLAEINKETGEVFSAEEIATFDPRSIGYRLYDGATIGSMRIDYFSKVFEAASEFVDKFSKSIRQLANEKRKLEDHNNFLSGARDVYAKLAENEASDELGDGNGFDLKTLGDHEADIKNRISKAEDEMDMSKKQLQEVLAGLKLHNQYDAPVENSYYYQSSIKVGSNVVLRHLNYSDFAALNLEMFNLCYNEDENALTGHPMMICGNSDDPNMAEDGFINDVNNKHTERWTLADSRKSIIKEWESSKEFQLEYNERQQTSEILAERVNTVLSGVNPGFVSSAKKSAASNGYELLDATIAKALTQTHAIKIEKVWKSIKDAILAGKFEVNFEGALPALTIQMLLDKNYSVSQGYDNKNYDKGGKLETVLIDGRGSVDAIDLFTNVSWADVNVGAAVDAIASNPKEDYFSRDAIKAMNEGLAK